MPILRTTSAPRARLTTGSPYSPVGDRTARLRPIDQLAPLGPLDIARHRHLHLVSDSYQALAQAVYWRRHTLILGDVFSELDAASEERIFFCVFGRKARH